jgi:hypothetical protein
METRRIRRLKQRHLRRVLVVMTSIGALGLGVGLALPRSTVGSELLLAVALVSLATIGLRAESLAPSHGLNRVVRLSAPSAISTALDSFRSKMVGTANAIRHRALPPPTGAADDLAYGADELVRPVDMHTVPQ